MNLDLRSEELTAKKFTEINIKELPEIDDNVNDILNTTSIIDGYNRTSPFVYFDGMIWGRRGSSHENIIKDIVKTKFDNDKNVTNELIDSRLGLEIDYPIACGHIIDDVAVIDKETVFNVSIDEVKNVLMSRYPIKKVYVTEMSDMNLKRVAKIDLLINDLR